jgi:hypothetical protein
MVQKMWLELAAADGLDRVYRTGVPSTIHTVTASTTVPKYYK